MDATQLDSLVHILYKKYRHIIGNQDIPHLSVEKIIELIINYHQDIISCMPGNIYWFDKNCIGVGCNRNVLEMFNFKSSDEFKGLSFEEMGKVGDWTYEATQSFKQDSIEVIQTGRSKLNIEEPPIPHSDGREIHFLSSRVPLFNPAGEAIGMVGVSIDITERKQMEMALLKAKASAEAANKLKIEFIHNMEHDIRTPFSGIYGIAKILADNETDPKKKDFLDDIVNCAKELLEYSTGILDFSMIESGSLPILSKKFSVHKLIEGLVAMEMPPAKVKELEFTAHCEANVPDIIMGDRYRLQRILINLISNAIKFTNKGSVKLSVKLAKVIDHRHVVLCFLIEDTGIGIPKEKQSIIFERFSRLLPSNQRLYKGQGLGLRLVRQFVDEMDGDIEIKSAVNKGTTFACTFTFKLPLVDNIMDED
ncbi:MAG: ATP-binding protein [Gammaproteobacteria bacterium]|nr:ATP-binding protein [Gammaproteobacteria bacterium]